MTYSGGVKVNNLRLERVPCVTSDRKLRYKTDTMIERRTEVFLHVRRVSCQTGD